MLEEELDQYFCFAISLQFVRLRSSLASAELSKGNELLCKAIGVQLSSAFVILLMLSSLDWQL